MRLKFLSFAGFIISTHITVDGGITLDPRHAWDPKTPSQMSDTLGLSPDELRTMRNQAPG